MSFRLQRLTTVYPAFAEQFLASVADSPSRSYADWYAHLTSWRFAESDFHAVHLRRLGHAAENLFLSVEPLQKQWADEHGLQFRPADWLGEIAAAQVAAFQPDVLLLDDLYVIDRAFRDRLRAACRRPPLVLGWRAAPTHNFAAFSDLDLVLTSIAGMAAEFRRHGVNARLLHHGFESSTLDAVPPAAFRDIELSFAGGLSSLHPERIEMVETLLRTTPLRIWGESGGIKLKDRLRHTFARFGWPQKPKSRMRTLSLHYPGRIHPPVFGCDYYRVLGRSRIVLNRHIDCAGHDASNMRLFEATGMGACLLTDNKRNLRDLFEPDVEVMVYDSLDDCVEKVRYLLAHDAERKAIAQAGQRRTLHDHTFSRRVETLAGIIEEALSYRARAA
jgi:spore maturation protein CgeB